MVAPFREFFINGPAMVFTQGGQHLLLEAGQGADETMAVRQELGLTSDAIRVCPNFYHKDVLCDSFGPNAPAEVMWNLADCIIYINLIHFDSHILGTCIQEAGAGGLTVNVEGGEMGEMAAASALLGNGLPLLASGNHFIELSIDCPIDNIPWIFPAAYLAQQPLTFPLGSEASLVQTMWRAIAYRPLLTSFAPVVSGLAPPELRSQGVRLWHHGI